LKDIKRAQIRPAAVALLILLLLAWTRVAGAATRAPYFTDLGQFNYARFLMDEGDYQTAAREFGRFIDCFPGSPLISEAQFRMAEAYLYSGRYSEAEGQFRLFISNFVDSPFAIVAEIKMQEARDKLKKAAPQPLPEIYREKRPYLRAVQVMLFEGRTYAEVESELESLAGAGVDTIIVRAFHNQGDRFYPAAKPSNKRGVYFKTSYAPVVDDFLPRVIEMAHSKGLKVFAWMTTRYADYGAEDDEGLACVSYDIQKMGYGRCKGLDLFNERAVQRLEGIYSDLASHEIDGVLFQDDLVMRHNEGFGEAAAALFEKETGTGLDPEALYIREPEGGPVHYTGLFWRWASWKNRHLVRVADRLKAVVKYKRPQAMFAINLMYESIVNPPYALAWLSQDLNEALMSDFDYFSIMAYHRQMGEELEKSAPEIRDMIVKMVGDASRAVGDPARVLIKVQTVDWRTGKPLADQEVVDLIREIKGARGVSLAVVPYRGGFPFGELSGGGLASIEGMR